MMTHFLAGGILYEARLWTDQEGDAGTAGSHLRFADPGWQQEHWRMGPGARKTGAHRSEAR